MTKSAIVYEEKERGKMTDWTWVAGLFEGEGSISLYSAESPYPRLRLSMVDEDVVRRFAAQVAPAGAVSLYNPPAVQKSGRQVQWCWTTGKFEHVQYVLAAMWPWLGARRQARAAEVLKLCKEKGR